MQPETDKQRRVRLMSDSSHMALMSMLAVHRLDRSWELAAGAAVAVPEETGTIEVSYDRAADSSVTVTSVIHAH